MTSAVESDSTQHQVLPGHHFEGNIITSDYHVTNFTRCLPHTISKFDKYDVENYIIHRIMGKLAGSQLAGRLIL